MHVVIDHVLSAERHRLWAACYIVNRSNVYTLHADDVTILSVMFFSNAVSNNCRCIFPANIDQTVLLVMF